jgi:hypothetical protein
MLEKLKVVVDVDEAIQCIVIYTPALIPYRVAVEPPTQPVFVETSILVIAALFAHVPIFNSVIPVVPCSKAFLPITLLNVEELE